MKKSYITPSIKTICLDTEESVLNNLSNLNYGDDIEGEEEVEGGSNRRTNSLWDSKW